MVENASHKTLRFYLYTSQNSLNIFLAVFFIIKIIGNKKKPKNNNLLWNWIWKLKCYEKIKHFIWITFHNTLFTNHERFCRNLCSSTLCPGCGAADETWIHILRDCIYTREVWKELHKEDAFFATSGPIWIKSGATDCKTPSIQETDPGTLFLTTI